MRTLLICHEGADLHRLGIARWLASFSTLAGIVVLREGPRASWRRARREVRRAGVMRFADVLAFRVYYRLFRAGADERWMEQKLSELCDTYPPLGDQVPVFHSGSPNSAAARQFIESCAPNVVLALCKVLLTPEVFSIPSHGTYALHPGICPEYRNAHGCFWALAHDDLDRVGMSLVRIDAGVDTGPIFGYYGYPFDEASESHIVIQHRVVLENLDALRDKLLAIHAGEAIPIETGQRKSAAWGQPWFTSYVKWQRRAKRRRADEGYRAAVS